MDINELISELNEKTAKAYAPRPQNGIRPHLSLWYPTDDGVVAGIVERVVDSLKSTVWLNEEIQNVSRSSAVALMAIPMDVEDKIPILHLVKKWAHITKSDENILAAILQSLLITDVHFNVMYTLRIVLFNYVTDSTIGGTSILKVLSNGMIELELRESVKIEGDASANFKILLEKLRDITSVGASMKTTFKTLAQYDYRRMEHVERAPQLATQLSSYNVSGFKKPDSFATKFGTTDLSALTTPPRRAHRSAPRRYNLKMSSSLKPQFEAAVCNLKPPANLPKKSTPKKYTFGDYSPQPTRSTSKTTTSFDFHVPIQVQ